MDTTIYEINTEINDNNAYHAWINAKILIENGSYNKKLPSILIYDVFACDYHKLLDVIFQFHKECYNKFFEVWKDSILMFPPLIYYHDDVGSKIIKQISPILNHW